MSLRGQEQIDFGDGHFVGPLYADPWFLESFDDPEKPDLAEQARYVGYVNGCPVVQELIAERGAEAMLNRYGEVNFWFTEIARMAEERNFPLYQALTTPVPRRLGESVGKHEPESVPEDHANVIAPMGTLVGWALPRLFIKQLGGAGQSVEVAQGRLDRGMAVLEYAVDHAASPAELLAFVAEGVSQADLTRQEVLQTILLRGWLEEQRSLHMVNEVKVALNQYAPEVWDAYVQMSASELAKLQILS